MGDMGIFVDDFLNSYLPYDSSGDVIYRIGEFLALILALCKIFCFHLKWLIS